MPSLNDFFHLPRKLKTEQDLLPWPAGPTWIDSTLELSSALSRYLPAQGETTYPTKAAWRLERNEQLATDSYTLRIAANGIQIEAADKTGAGYGIQTLMRLRRRYPEGCPTMEIEDGPDFPVRGYMLDISRCRVPTMDELRALIPLLRRLRYNQLQLYTEHTFAYSQHQMVWEGASPMRPEEICELDTLCREAGIDLVPNQNSFGHFERWLRHSAYHPLAECPNGFQPPWGNFRPVGSTLYPDAQSLQFLNNLYDELLPNFTCPRFNIGCDETFELGQGRSRARVEERGRPRVYLDFLKQICASVIARGREPMFWGDIIHEDVSLMTELPRPITALEWGYEADHPFEQRCADFSRAEVPFYVCPGTSSWRSIVGRTRNLLGNLDAAARQGAAAGATGWLLTDWGDLGHLQTPVFSLPGLTLGAGKAWRANAELHPETDLDEILGDEKTAAWILDIGRVQDLVSQKFSNSSPFFHRLLPARHIAVHIPEQEVAACRQKLNELRDRLPELKPADTRILPELSWSLDVIDWSFARPMKKLPELVERHRDLWRTRSRPGGLEESCSVLSGSDDL